MKILKNLLIKISISVILLFFVQCAHRTYILHNLTRDGKLEEIRTCLRDSVCRKSINMLDNSGRSALHTATFNFDLPVIQELLSGGADPNVKDNTGAPPLLYAAKTDNETVFAELLKGEADINVKIKDGRSILMDLILYGTSKNVNLLLEYNADLTVKDSLGRDALIFACIKGDSLLLKKIIDIRKRIPVATHSCNLVRVWGRGKWIF